MKDKDIKFSGHVCHDRPHQDVSRDHTPTFLFETAILAKCQSLYSTSSTQFTQMSLHFKLIFYNPTALDSFSSRNVGGIPKVSNFEKFSSTSILRASLQNCTISDKIAATTFHSVECKPNHK